MKKYFGLILLGLSLQSMADSSSAVLMLRAYVPETYKVEVHAENNAPKVTLHSNRQKSRAQLPHTRIEQKNSVYLVSIVQP